ncbi:MAG: hydroxyphenylacetyl-CoA thioesterase PaaI [Oceanospirillales bacterium]|uniref:Acyl-CoA thioesterase n=1 Tax=Marinobacterium halophilum TaxID=267374 RepID=A0A2P8EKN7_9GAMM|nr:hydroxyphenylacetyl-CoA thioesterase PaaI [Marinobacterium halophilum]MBR9828195.1 hydroxyphenylacetyl-CoA thioesterase PaaI [Oceanospirillales bacterium]PSL10012.1 acyl-CoA thioesterase [Marinobacterium halophilum]
MNVSEMTPEQLAEASSAAMHENDHAAKGLNIQIEETRPGYARLSMKIRKDMLNGHGMCHGGFIFALSDTAFAHACNSYNKVTVASGCSIEFVAPGFLDDTLTAVAQERQRKGRTGVYDITVYNQNNEELAFFRGKSYQIKGTLLPEDETTARGETR